jgi:hypothetical protein
VVEAGSLFIPIHDLAALRRRPGCQHNDAETVTTTRQRRHERHIETSPVRCFARVSSRGGKSKQVDVRILKEKLGHGRRVAVLATIL